MTINSVLLATKGDIKKAKIKFLEEDEDENGEFVLSINAIQSYFRKKSEPELLGNYEYESYVIYIFGYKDGKAGTENKHELPPPYDNLIAFGDILVIASNERSWEKPCDFTVELYNKFYESAMGGFDSVDDGSSLDGEDSVISEEDVADDAVDDEEVVDDEEGGEDIESEVEAEVEEAPKPKKASSAAKKAAVSSSGYQKQQQLLSQINFKELTAEENSAGIRQRQVALKRFSFLGDDEEGLAGLEAAIYVAACKEADKLKVV